MERQTICVIGGGLTGLITALTLVKLNLKIDLISDNIEKNIKTNRTTAISQENYNFLKKLNIFNSPNSIFWPCSKMKLYSESALNKFTEIFQLDNDKKNQEKIFYMMNNSKIISELIKKVKNEKLIKLKKQKKVSGIINFGSLKSLKLDDKNQSKYNLIIICTGSNSDLVKNLFHDEPYKYDYKELGITTILKHNKIKNNVTRQIFSNEGIFALLPISDTKTSVVWSVKKKIIKKYEKQKDKFLKNKILLYTKPFLKNIKIASKIESKNLNLILRKNFISERVLLFGEALHEVHPLAGQGFNMTLRDLTDLEKLLKTKTNLGLDVGSHDILSEFVRNIKSKNLVYSVGIDLLKNSFSFENKYLIKFRNSIMNSLNKNTSAKKIFYNIANKGLRL